MALMMMAYPAQGQDNRKVPISFLPPPLETATYSLGIYDAKTGKLVRHLQEAATASAFTAGDNGLITSWDGKDDAGKAVAPGKYAARGYAVGALKVEGEEILGNDWASDDEGLRLTKVEAMILVPEDGGLVVVGDAPDNGSQMARYSGSNGKLLWQHTLPLKVSTTTRILYLMGDKMLFIGATKLAAYRLSDGGETELPARGSPMPSFAVNDSQGKDGTVWSITRGVLTQFSEHGDRLRTLVPKDGEPVPVAVEASSNADRLYLLESAGPRQRVRGLWWVETKQEDGNPVSMWQTFFERNIRPPDPALGLDEPDVPVEVSLVENPLDPGKPQKVRLQAKVDDTGSYLVAADGLRLRRISQRANLKTVKLVKGKSANSLTFFQNDGAAWDEFSIEGVRNIMAFDAGEVEMTADGEKTHTEKAAEPPDL